MRDRHRLVGALALALVSSGCSGTLRADISPPASAEIATPTPAATTVARPAATFPTAAFADVSEDPVSEEAAAEFQAIIGEAAGGVGLTATVMSANGTWVGAVGKADGVRDVRIDDQFAIGSITKSVIAAQVMQLVEAGELALDDPAADHVPLHVDFDTNGATIRQLLGMRSGIPDYVDALWASLSTDRQRRWTSAEVLDLVAATRSPAGTAHEYSSTNYVLLGMIIEQVRGRPLAGVLRDGVLSGDGLERFVFQPDEAPTEPMAMPGGESAAALELGGGLLPSLAGATAAFAAGAMVSDSASLARWWSRFCGGEIVSEATLTEMAAFDDGYGLGLSNDMGAYGAEVGHGGLHVGYAARAMCFVGDGSVVVVLTNREDLVTEVAAALGAAARSD